MAEITLNNTYFGPIIFDTDDGLWERYPLEQGGEDTEVLIEIEPGAVEPEDIDLLDEFLEVIEQVDEVSKKAFVSQFSRHRHIKGFYDHHIKFADPKKLCAAMGTSSVGMITPEAFINKLKLCRIYMECNDRCRYDFALDQRLTDVVLSVTFNHNIEPFLISREM